MFVVGTFPTPSISISLGKNQSRDSRNVLDDPMVMVTDKFDGETSFTDEE